MATGGESAQFSHIDNQGHTNGRLEVLEQVAYLPLLHKLVEEGAGERRFTTFYIACHVLGGTPLPSPPHEARQEGTLTPALSRRAGEGEGSSAGRQCGQVMGSMHEFLFRRNLSPLTRGEGTNTVCLS
jgi:hypothetical protein